MRLNQGLKDKELLIKVWEKAAPVKGLDPNLWRMDYYGRYIFKYHYCIRQSEWGWEVDDVTPRFAKGAEVLHDYRPLNWRSSQI